MSVKGIGSLNSNIAIIGEAPSREDVQVSKAFSGSYGALLRQMCEDAGFNMYDCYLTLAAKKRALNGFNPWFWKRPQGKSRKAPPGYVYQDGLFVRPELTVWREDLMDELAECKANVLVPLGEIGLWQLTGTPHITKWRGSTFYWTHPTTGRQFKVIPTHAPEEVMKRYDLRFIVAQDLRRVLKESTTVEIAKPMWTFVIRPDYTTVMRELQYYIDNANEWQHEGRTLKISSDIETRAGHIACIGLGISTMRAICIPFMCIENEEGYWTFEEEFSIICRMKELLEHPNVRIVGQNYLYDLQYTIKHWGIAGEMHMDTMLAQHVCFPGLKKSLDFIASMYCEYYCYWKDEGKNWEVGLDEDQLWAYNCQDVVYTLECSQVLERVIDSRKVRGAYEMMKDKYPLVLETMLRGVRIDTKRRNEFTMLLMDAMAQIEQWFEDVLGHHLNPKSPKQMAAFFYDDMQQKVIRNRQTRQPTCDDAALTVIALREPLLRPVCEKIAEYRTMGVFLSTFVRASLDWDNRIRCSYALAGTETFRLKSSKDAFGMGTNLQNIPANQND